MRLIHGIHTLAHEAVDAVVDLVDEGQSSTHRNIKRVLSPLGETGETLSEVEDLRALGDRAVLGVIKAVNHVVRDAGAWVVDRVETEDRADLPQMRADSAGSLPWLRDAALGALNGVIGDHLAKSGEHPADLGFCLRFHDGLLSLGSSADVLAQAGVGRTLVVLVHGLSTTEWSWNFQSDKQLGDASENFGTRLERDLGFAPVFARYNTGRAITVNAADLADALEALSAVWPVELERIVLLGHSMGGLVACEAAAEASARELSWTSKLSHVVCLGSPHEGAPLARATTLLSRGLAHLDLPAINVMGAILDVRSEGICDLDGGISRERRVPGVHYAFAAGTLDRDAGSWFSQRVGDGLVPVQSGLSEADDTATFDRVSHLAMQTDPRVYGWLCDVLGRGVDACASEGVGSPSK